jgi:sulfoxide reductase catalytic subunit YedY
MKSDPEKNQTVTTRRVFIKISVRVLAGMGLILGPVSSIFRRAWAETKRIILPKGTKMSSLVNQNPATLDTRNLDIVPLDDFETMGLTEHPVDIEKWRLEVTGAVRKPLQLTYGQLLDLPSIERNVLLICPGFFTNHGRWKGISVAELLKMAESEDGVAYVSFRGPAGRYAKIKRFPIDEISSDKIFLAYKVNGKVLPEKHGYPLRVVAEDHYGFEWVKFVHKIEVIT